MSPRQRDSGPATRERMIDTALDLIGDRGYEGTSLQMVADATGVTKAAVYYHFRTKAELLDALLQRLFADGRAFPDPRVLTTRRSRLLWLAEQVLSTLTTDRKVLSVINGDPVIRRHPTFVSLVEETQERALVLVFGEQPTAADRATFHLATAAVYTLPMLEKLSDEELIEALRPAVYRTLGLPAPAAR